MDGWTDFFVAEVGASAALAGLLVVAISINIERILAYPTLPGRAANTLIIIASALMVASFALVPKQPLWIFGCEALAIVLGLALSGIRELGVVLGHHRRKPDNPIWWVIQSLLGLLISTVPYLVGGILLVAGNDAGLYWIGIGIILSFVATLQNGWVLLVEILR